MHSLHALYAVLTYTRRTEMPVPPERLFAWHDGRGAFERLTPPWQPVELARFEGIRDGQRAVIKLGPKPAQLTWTAEHFGFVEGEVFRDRQVEGPFAAWEHAHRMLPSDEPGRSMLEDHVAYELPLAPVSEWVGGRKAEAELARLFAYRHRVTRADLARHAAAGLGPSRVGITGSSGLIGSALASLLTTGGHTVVRLVRSREQAAQLDRSDEERAAFWDPETGVLDRAALDGLDAVVHLAGEPVYGLWTEAKKRRIRESRARGTRLLAGALAGLDRPPRALLSASAVGFYGSRGDAVLTEGASAGTGFLADVCRAWEDATEPAEAAGIRTCRLRIGVVLSPAGGFLQAALPAFRLGLGGSVGGGHQWVPWIALDDVLYAVLHLLAADGLSGPVNVTAPNPVRLNALVRTLGEVLRRPTPLRLPSDLVRALGGELARETALTSARAVPERLENSGFAFAYSHLEIALRHLLGATDAVPAPTA